MLRMEECILRASCPVCSSLRRGGQQNSKERSAVAGLWCYLDIASIKHSFSYSKELEELEAFEDSWRLPKEEWRRCSGGFRSLSGEQGTRLTSKSKLFIWVWMLCASSAGTPLKCLSLELPVSLITMANGTIHLTHFSISHH